MASVEEPMLSRLNRLDNILKQLEEIRSANYYSPKSSSYASTASSTDITSSADDVSPRSTLEKKKKKIIFYRPIDEVMMEVEEKGTLLERLVHAEDRILKMCLHLEDELESERSKELQHQTTSDEAIITKKKKKKSPLKKLMKSFVGGKEKHSHNNDGS